VNLSSDSARGTVWLRVAIVAAVLLIAGAGAGMVLDTAPSGSEVVDRVAERYDSADSYTSTVAVDVTYANDSGTVERSGRARVLFSQPDNYRAEVLAPDELNGTVAATNGSVAWVTRPAGTTVVRSLNETQQGWLEDLNVTAALDRFQERADVTRQGTTTIDGTETYVLSVRPANESVDANATVWVDTDDYDVRQLRTTGTHNGTTVTTTVRYERISFGVSIHESTFRPPTDRSVVLAGLERSSYDSLAAATDDLSFPVTTAAVPSGFESSSVVLGERGDSQTLVVTYENETDRIAVVRSQRNPLSRLDADTESVTIGDANVSYLRARDRGVVFWRANNRTYAVAGSVDRDTLVSVAESLVE
jgi:outer membrane lipoprotein-sorting protein